MLHVITLYSVAAKAAGPFAHSIHRGGEWRTLASRLAPALIATDLLERQPSQAPFLSRSSTLYICIDFWNSPDAYRRACLQPSCRALFDARRRMARCAFELGAFGFPAATDIETQAAVAVAARG